MSEENETKLVQLTEKLNLESHSKDSMFVSKLMKSDLTLNSYGVMVKIPNPHFLLSMKIIDKSKPVADLGVAYGFTTKLLLENGFEVIANDLEEKHLKTLEDSLTPELKAHVKLIPGDAFKLDFEENSLGGIMAIRWLYFLTGEQLREQFKKFYKWLAPGGVLVAVCSTPFSTSAVQKQDPKKANSSDNYENLFYDRLKQGVEWPGEFNLNDLGDSVIGNLFKRILPQRMNTLTIDLLIREVTLAGFHILKAEYFDIDMGSNQHITDGLQKVEASIICYKRN